MQMSLLSLLLHLFNLQRGYKQRGYISTTAYIIFIQVFKNSIKKITVEPYQKIYIKEFFCFMNLIFEL